MQVTFTRTMVCALVSLAATAAFAQNAQLVSHMQFAELQQDVDGELAELKARLVSLEKGDMGALQKGADCCCCDCWCNPCCGWVGSAELVFLRPHDSYSDSATSGEFQSASRWMVGSMDGCGRTWRARYYEFRHDDFDDDALHQLIVDAEYAARFELGCNWRGELAAGLRYAEYEDNDMDYRKTIGPVISAEVRNQLWCDVDIFALYRRSQQFGTEESDDERGTFGITELQVGAEVVRCIGGNDMFLRGFIEAQEWAGIEDNSSEDLGLIGFGVAVGLAR